MITVIDNYDSFTWNLVHYLEQLGAETRVYRNDVKTSEEILAEKPDGIVLSPGPCSPNEAGICVDLIQKVPDALPVFGVCLGHQSIGQAFGGTVDAAQAIMHGKISAVHHEKDPMFEGIPDGFEAVRYHSLSVLADDLPETLEATAWTDDGEIMGLRHKKRPIFGVQFHPESIGTEHGFTLLRTFLAHCGVKT